MNTTTNITVPANVTITVIAAKAATKPEIKAAVAMVLRAVTAAYYTGAL